MLNVYWEYAGTRYKQKLRAINASHGDIMNISFHGFKSFQSFDWSKEPSQSLNELMLTRALMLRDTYKYIKFWYSGGTDSHTALKVFLDNKIHIDEIIVYRFSVDNDFDNNPADYELNQYTIPYLKTLQTSIPKTKFTFYEFGKDYYDEYFGEKWLHTKNSLVPRHYQIPKINGNNWCSIFCDADPEIKIENGEYFLYMYDMVNYGELASYRNIELFYTDEMFPELHCKQAHIIKRYLKDHNLNPDNMTVQQYKDILRTQLRINPIVQEPVGFQRPENDQLSFILGSKDRYQYKKMTKQQHEQFKYQINASVKGIPLFRLIRGYSCGRFSLGV